MRVESQNQNKIRRRAHGVELSCPITSHTEKTLDEVILFWPKSQKPIFPLEAIFIFPFRVCWWFHKNSWKNINGVLTHLCLKVFPLSLGWFLLYILIRLQEGQPVPETNWNPQIWIEREVWLLQKTTDFQSNLPWGIANWCPIFSHTELRHLFHPISNRNWSLELNHVCPLVLS